jgi:hypothetical protein
LNFRFLRRAFAAAGRSSVNLSRWGVAFGCIILVSLLVFFHARAQDAGVRRSIDVVAQLTTMKLIDARWDVAALRARTDAIAPSDLAVQSGDLTRIQRALDAAAAQARSNVLRSSVDELKKAYAEKADLVTRFQQACNDSRLALDAAMRADAAITRLVRSAWREFPQRDRLVAAENLVSRLLTQAQQYHHAPSAAHRATLESAVAELARAHSLPRAVEAGLHRLESDIHQLLLLKPLEHMLGERLGVLDTGTRANELTETFQRELADSLARRDRYRIALMVYSTALLLLGSFLLARAYRYHRMLEERYIEQAGELAWAMASLDAAKSVTDAGFSANHDRSADTEGAHVRFTRRQ